MDITCLFQKQLEVAYNKIKDKIKPKSISPNLKQPLFGLHYIATFGSFLVRSIKFSTLNLLFLYLPLGH